MIGIVEGRCAFGNQAINACFNPKCSNPAFCCEVTICLCRNAHEEC